MGKIKFIEHPVVGYPARTIQNIMQSDITIAIGVNLFTPGERLTARIAKEKYFPIAMKEKKGVFEENTLECLIEALVRLRPLRINIAGNGIYNFPGWMQDQVMINFQITNLLGKAFLESKFRPTLIRSGGQTGIDEAGLIAATIIGIPALCLAPNGWLFRDKSGKDIADEIKFKERFK